MTERERALLQGKKINPLTANESALAYAVAHGGSAPTYEVVAEIPVGTMEKPGDSYPYYFSSDASITIPSGEDLYFNSSEYPLTAGTDGTDAHVYLYNMSSKGEVVGDPAFGLVENDGAIIVYSSTDLSNTTVRILKKVEEPSGDGAFEVQITLTSLTTATLDNCTYSDLLEMFPQRQIYTIISGSGYTHRVDFLSLNDGYGVGVSSDDNEGLSIVTIYKQSETEITISTKQLKALPDYDSLADAGKVLTVTNNGLAWVTH